MPALKAALTGTGMNAYTQGLNSRIYSVNEVRDFEDMPARADGDEPLPHQLGWGE